MRIVATSMYPRTPVKATIPSDTQNPGNGLSRRRLSADPPARAAHREESEPGREAGGGRMSRRTSPSLATTDPRGYDTMQMATTLRRSTHTFLTHLFGPGLDDDRYLVERFQSMADGEIRRRRGNGASKKGRSKGCREIASLSTVQRMRPERDEIIICTGVNCTNLGVQYWGDRAVGLFVNAKYR